MSDLPPPVQLPIVQPPHRVPVPQAQQPIPQAHATPPPPQQVSYAEPANPPSRLTKEQMDFFNEHSKIPVKTPQMLEEDEEDYRLARNPIFQTRKWFVPYVAEFLGTMVFVMFGCGANAQVVLTQRQDIGGSLPRGNWTSLALGWGAGLAMGIWISGGHVNPAVTLAMSVFRGFPWRRLPGYWLAQLLGGICGAAIVYGNYIRAIDIFEGGRDIRTLETAGLFGTVPLTYVTNLECFFSEFTGAALLVMGIFALLDRAKNNWTSGIIPIGIFILFTGIAVSFGAQTSFAHNPARDLGPRMFTAMVGYGRQVFTFRNWYWLYSPVLGGLTGGLLGAGLYDLFLYQYRGNFVNRLLLRGRIKGGIVNAPQPAPPYA